MTALNLYQTQLINQVATDLKIANPEWLSDLIRFESGYDPKAKNPLSSARGLIQFIDSTARGMGFKSSQDLVNKYPDFESQLFGPVTDYLKQYTPFPTEQSLYMAVFFPAARKYPANYPFSKIFLDVYGSSWSDKYKRFERGNPGIKTPQDYINYVKKKPAKRVATKIGVGVFGLILILFAYKKLT